MNNVVECIWPVQTKRCDPFPEMIVPPGSRIIGPAANPVERVVVHY